VIHAIFLVGEIKKIQVSEPKDPRKTASAVVLIQYGPTRESTGGPVEFVNAVMVRIPSYKFPQLRDKLHVGSKVQINGHLQGVFKSMMEDGFFTAELVADRVFVEEETQDQGAATSNAGA
jgi:hypothetical protein